MDWKIAKQSLDLFNKLNCDEPRIKFFGGEPLLEFNLIRSIVEYNNFLNKKIRYELTTNGTLLNEYMLNFFKKNNFELHISIDGDKKTQTSERGKDSWGVFDKLNLKDKEEVIVNMVASPRTVHKFYGNFIFLFENGFKKFNILPAFFCDWSEKQISIFHKELAKIAESVNHNGAYILNKDILQENYLFNDGYIIDYNGDIYQDNRIMTKQYQKFKKSLKLNNIKDIKSFSEIKKKKVSSTVNDAHFTNLNLDKSISQFVDMIK